MASQNTEDRLRYIGSQLINAELEATHMHRSGDVEQGPRFSIHSPESGNIFDAN